MDDITFFKMYKSRIPNIWFKAKGYFAVLSMSAPLEALFSRIGDIVTKKRRRFMSITIKILAILRSRGIIRAEEMPDEILDTEEKENSTPLDGGRTTKLRKLKITDVLERVDDTGRVIDDDKDHH